MESFGIRPETLRSFIEALGVKKVLRVLTAEERLKALSIEDIISVLSPEETISALGGRKYLLTTLFA